MSTASAAGSRARARRQQAAMLAAIALTVAVVSYRTFTMRSPSNHDDAFIAFRYAKNLAVGRGPVFNPGERIWGYTSPLQVLVLALLGMLGADIPTAALVLGIAASAISCWLVFRIFSRALGDRAGLFVGALHLSCVFTFAYLSLETAWVGALLWAFLALVWARRHVAASFVGALACLARPDSLLLVLPVILFSGRGLRSARSLLAFALPGACWLAFTRLYYGRVLPNSFYAKASVLRPSADTTKDVFEYGKTWLSTFLEAVVTGRGGAGGGWALAPRALERPLTVVLVALVVASTVTLLSSSRMRGARCRPLLIALVAYPWATFVAYSIMRPPASHTWEYWNAMTFLLTGVLAVPAIVCSERFASSRRSQVVLGSFLGAAVVVGSLHKSDAIRDIDTAYWNGNRHRAYTAIAQWLKANAPPDARLGYGEPGTIAYLSDIRVYDNLIVSRAPATPPEYVLISNIGSPEVDVGGDRYLRVQSFREFGFAPLDLFQKRGGS